MGVYLPGELPGVTGRPCEGGELGVEGRRKGEARGEPKDNGEGRKGALGVTCGGIPRGQRRSRETGDSKGIPTMIRVVRYGSDALARSELR